MEGGCACGKVRYRLAAPPLFVHCCHCRHCQRETGSAFVTNGMIETDCIGILQGEPAVFDLPTASGKGQKVYRCGECGVALWSVYGGPGPLLSFLRMGTLDEPGAYPPGAHMFATCRQDWVELPDGVPAAETYFDRAALWPAASLERLDRLFAGQS